MTCKEAGRNIFDERNALVFLYETLSLNRISILHLFKMLVVYTATTVSYSFAHCTVHCVQEKKRSLARAPSSTWASSATFVSSPDSLWPTSEFR